MPSTSNTVDSKIVELQFQNQNFESNAKTSLSTLDKLKNALNFSNKAKVFDDIASGVKKIDVLGLSRGIDVVQAKFSALDVVTKRVLENMTDKVVNATSNFIKSVSVDQISAGWDKYAEKTQAVQTIMAATSKDWTDTGAQMEYVNSQLEKLNWFTDETSYNFLDMVNNIGKFTSNNIALDKSVTSMQGISTWAAVSGANIQEAGRAMYNLSQAIATGSVKLMDWKSIENANMATAEFKETALEAAVEVGTLTKEADGLYKTVGKGTEVTVSGFNTTLSEAWFTSDVLLKTLDRYGGFTDELYALMEKLTGNATTSQVLEFLEQYKDGSIDFTEASREMGISVAQLKTEFASLSDDALSLGVKAFKAAQEAKTFGEAVDSIKDAVSTGWMNTFETLFGDYSKAKVLWTDLANQLYEIFAEGGNARNELLSEAFEQQATINESDWKKLTKAGLASPEFIAEVRRNARLHHVYTEMFSDDETWLQAVLEKGLITMDDVNAAYEKTFGSGARTVDEGLKSQVEGLLKTDEAFNDLAETLKGYSGEDLEKVVFGDGKLAEGSAGDLEKALDKVVTKLGLTQGDGKKVADVFKSLGYFGKEAADEVNNLGTKAKDADEVLKEIQAGHMSTGELWTDTLTIGMQTLVDLFGIAKTAFENIFPPMTADTITDIVVSLHNFVSGLNSSINESETLTTVFEGVFSVFRVLLDVVTGLISGGFDVLSAILNGLGIDLESVAVNLANLAIGFKNWLEESGAISKAFTFIATVAGHLASGIRYLVDEFLKIDGVSRTIANFRAGFLMAFKNIGPFFDGLTEHFNKFVERFKELDGFSLENVSKAFGIFKEEILDYMLNFPGFKGLKAAFAVLKEDVKNGLLGIGSSIWEYLQNLRESLDGTFAGDILGGVLDTVQKIFDMFSGTNKEGEETVGETNDILGQLQLGIDQFMMFMQGINWGAVAAAGTGFAALFGVVKIILTVIGAVKKIKKTVINTVKDTFGSISDAFDEMGSFFKAKKMSTVIGAIKWVAIAIGILTACVYALSTIDPADGFRAIAMIGILGLMLTGIALIMSKIKLGFRQSISLIPLTLAIKVMAGIVKSLSDIGMGEAGTALTIIGLVSAILGALAYAVGKSGIGFWKGVSLIPIALAIKVMAGIVKSLAQIEPNSALNASIVAGILGTILAVLSHVVGKSNIGFWKGVSLLPIALAIKVMAGIVKSLSGIDNNDALNATVIVGLLGAVLAAVAYALNNVNIGFRTSFGLIAIVAAIGILSIILKDLSAIKPEGLNQALIAIGVLGSILALIGWMVGQIEPGFGSSMSLVAIAVAITLLKNIVVELSTLKPDGLTQALIAVGVLGTILAAIAFVLTKVKPSLGAVASIVVISGTFLLLVQSVKQLAELDSDGLNQALVAIGILSACLAGLMIVSKFTAGDLKDLGGIGALAGAVATLATALGQLAKVDPERLQTATFALSMVMGIFALLQIVQKFAGTATASIFIMVAVVAALALVLGLLSNLTDPKDLLTTAESLSLLIAAMSGMMLALTFAGSFGPAALVGAAELAGIIVGFGVLAGALGALLTYFPDLETFVNTGIDLLVSIGEGIGRVVGAIFGGFVGESMSALPEIGGYITGFVEALKPIAGESVNWEAVAGAIAAVAGIKFTELFTAVADGITELATGNSATEQFVEDVGNLATSMTTWAETMKTFESLDEDISNEPVKELTAAVKEVKFTELFTTIGDFAAELITGNTATEQFIEDVENLATAMSTWKEKTEALGAIKVDNGPIRSLVVAVRTVPTRSLWQAISDSIKEGITGESDVEKFKTDASTLAETLSEWQTKMDEVGAITVPTEEIEQLAEAIKKVPDTGIWQSIEDFVTGSTDTEDFRDSIKDLGDGLKAFSDAIGSDFKDDKLKSATAAIDALSALGAASGNVTSLSTLIDSSSYLVSALTTMAKALNGFTEDIKDSNKLLNIAYSMKATIDVLKDLSGDDNKVDLSAGDISDAGKVQAYIDNLNAIIEAISSLATADYSGVGQLTTAVDQLNQANLSDSVDKLGDAAKKAASDQVDEVGSTGGDMGGSMAESLGDQTGAMADAIGALAMAAVEAAVKYKSDFNAAGIALASAFGEGISSSSEPSSAASTMGSNASSSISTGGAFDSGTAFATGFSNGIRNGIYLAETAAALAGRKALDALKKSIAQGSPSKLTYKSGAFFTEGFINGISSLTPDSGKAAKELGKETVDGLRQSIKLIRNILGSDLEVQPMIRPVVDLDEIHNGVSTINSLMGFNQPIGFFDNINSISANSASLRRSATTDDIYAALQKMAMNETPRGDTYVIDGITYDDGSNVSLAVKSLIHAARVERRI